MAHWWTRLRERKLGRWTLAYLAGAWLGYEVLSQVGENFAWPAVVMRVVTVVLAVGLPMVVVVGWFHGEKGHQRVRGTEILLLSGLLLLGAIVARLVVEGAGAAGSGPTTPIAGAYADILVNSLAVLPLENRSRDPDQEYFSDGLTEELMTALSRVPGLRLAARTSSFAFKQVAASADSIARVLRVRHLLDGSVRRDGEELRIAVALIDARDGYELWSRTYSRPALDVFAIQREIARAVVDALPLDPVLLDADWEPPGHATSVEAHDLYLRGKEAWNRRTGPELLRAVDLFEQAIALDSAYAPAWAALAETYVILPGYTSVTSRTALSRLRQAAARALELDSLLVQAHTALGYGTAWMSYDFPLAIRTLDRALAIDPDYATALHWQGELLAHAGRFEQARERFELAMELDPLAGVIRADFGQALQLAGEHEAAIELLEPYLAEHPGYPIAEYWLFYPALLTGRHARAEQLIRSLSDAFGLEPDGMALAVRAVGGDAPTEEGISALDAQPRSTSEIGLMTIAALYGQLGALDEGFAILERGADSPFQGVVYLVTHPVFAPFRDDPRYEELAGLVTL
jgi:adenylate cyclase